MELQASWKFWAHFSTHNNYQESSSKIEASEVTNNGALYGKFGIPLKMRGTLQKEGGSSWMEVNSHEDASYNKAQRGKRNSFKQETVVRRLTELPH